MKTWEALKAADEGKKIRQSFWGEGVYSFKKDSRLGVCKSMLAIRRRKKDPAEFLG
nr:MAG TPA: Protein of unknown function (DUF2829) [Caudoviricetes sp.]